MHYCNRHFCMHCCTHWLLLYSLLQIIIHFICTIPIEKLCINYCKWQLLYTQLQMTTFVCTVRNDNFCIHCYIWQPQLSTFSSIALHYYNCWFILILLQSTTCVCIIAVVNFCMHHFKWQPMYALLYLTTFFMHYCNLICTHSCNWGIQHQDDQKHWL